MSKNGETHLLLLDFTEEIEEPRGFLFSKIKKRLGFLSTKAESFLGLTNKKNVWINAKTAFLIVLGKARGFMQLQKVIILIMSERTTAFKFFGNFLFSRQKKEGDKTYEVIARIRLPTVRTVGKLGGQMFIQKLAQWRGITWLNDDM